MLSTAWSAEEARVQTLGGWQAICCSTAVSATSWSRPTEWIKEGHPFTHEINPSACGVMCIEHFDTAG